jgi:HSP20 family protein
MAERDEATRDGDESPNPAVDAFGGLGGLTNGIANLLGKLGELAEKGEELRKSGEFQTGAGNKDAKASYGFSMRFGAGDKSKNEPQVQSFKKTNRPKNTAKPQVEDREPQVDVFNEGDHLLVVAEMPGIAKEDILVEFEDKQLTLTGKSSRVRFRKQIELPLEVTQDAVQLSINNGVVELKLQILP